MLQWLSSILLLVYLTQKLAFKNIPSISHPTTGFSRTNCTYPDGVASRSLQRNIQWLMQWLRGLPKTENASGWPKRDNRAPIVEQYNG